MDTTNTTTRNTNAEDLMDRASRTVEKYWNSAEETAKKMLSSPMEFIDRNPTYAVLIAFSVGVMLGSMLNGRRASLR